MSDKEEEKIATIIPVPNWNPPKNAKPRYILVKAESVLKRAFQFWALTQTWKNGGMYTEEVGDISKGEFFLCMKLSRGAPNNATIKHLFDGVDIEYRIIEKPAIDKLAKYPEGSEYFGNVGHGYDPNRLGFKRPAWACNLPKDDWDDDDE